MLSIAILVHIEHTMLCVYAVAAALATAISKAAGNYDLNNCRVAKNHFEILLLND